jgi:hypothetical protein
MISLSPSYQYMHTFTALGSKGSDGHLGRDPDRNSDATSHGPSNPTPAASRSFLAFLFARWFHLCTLGGPSVANRNLLLVATGWRCWRFC